MENSGAVSRENGGVVSRDKSVYSRDFSEYLNLMKRRALEAFADDLGQGDITSDAIFGGDSEANARVVAEDDCVLAGVLEARTILEDGSIEVSGLDDGSSVKPGGTVLSLKGRLKQILARERVALNYLTRMSSIATLSRELYESYSGRVLFLRKTDPGLLFSEKRAVAIGGCLPHRINLSDGILIKDNHIDELAVGGDRLGAVREAISRADGYRNRKKFLPIEVEVESLDEARAAAEELAGLRGPNIIMLDNMGPKDVTRAAGAIRAASCDIIVEASGGIKRDDIGDYLEAGADYVSTSIFLSAGQRRFKLEITR